MRTGFIAIRCRLDQSAGGQQQIVDMLPTIISDQSDQ